MQSTGVPETTTINESFLPTKRLKLSDYKNLPLSKFIDVFNIHKPETSKAVAPLIITELAAMVSPGVIE